MRMIVTWLDVKGLKSDQVCEIFLMSYNVKSQHREMDTEEHRHPEENVTYYLSHDLTLTLFGLNSGDLMNSWDCLLIYLGVNVHITWDLISSSPKPLYPQHFKMCDI